MLFGIISPSSLIIARPGVPLPCFSQLSGIPGLFIKLSVNSLIRFSVFSFSAEVIALFVSNSDALRTIPLMNRIIIKTIAISITIFPLLSIIFPQPVFFPMGTVQN